MKSKIEVLAGGWTPQVALHQVLEKNPTRVLIVFECDETGWAHASCNMTPAEMHLMCGVMQQEIINGGTE